MASRRTFLKACAASAIAGPIASQAATVSNTAAPHYRAVFDERFEHARTFAAQASERGITIAAIRGDITKLFFEDLDLRWKQGPVVLTGYTTPESLFCLDLLARDRGMRVTQRVAKPGPLIFWTIAPRGTP